MKKITNIENGILDKLYGELGETLQTSKDTLIEEYLQITNKNDVTELLEEIQEYREEIKALEKLEKILNEMKGNK